MSNTNTAKVTKIINNYFDGIYTGNIEQLNSCFHSNTFLYGDINEIEYFKPFNEYLEGVKNRKSPQEQGETNKMKIISLEILGNVAMSKVHLPMLGFNYYDFLSLAIVSGEWKIVNKIFTHVA